MAEDLPYMAEYAKSGRAGCKGCKTNIPQGKLRIARMVQSAFFDGKQANWYHDNCFFMKQRPKDASEIGNFRTLRYDDQKRIKEEIEKNGSGVIMPVEKPKKGKGTKRAKASDGASSSGAIRDFAVEYSKSSRATCVVCEIKIIKGEVRICKIVYDTEVGQKFGGQPLWHHVKCFAENRSELLYFAGGELLPGFNSLKKEDKDMVKKEIPALKQDEVPVKKLKEEPKDKDEADGLKKNEKEIQDQSKLFYRFRDSLKKNLKKSDYVNLLEHNLQEVPSGEDRMLDRLADAMAFGSLKPCKVCKMGQLVLGTYGYNCTGDLTEWTKCQNSTTNPDRVPFTFPANYKEVPTFSRYKFKPKTRIFEKTAPPVLIKSESEIKKIKSDKPVPPLKNLEFFIYGLSKNSKETVKNRILKLGGNVTSKVHEKLAAVIANENSVNNMPDKMTEIQSMDIQVIDPSFLDEIKNDGTIAQSIDLIKEKNIASWGSDPVKRIPQDVIDGKSIPKSSSMYKSKSMSGKTKLKLKGGTAVDPDSGLEDIAHVYIDNDGEKYSVVLGLTDIVSKKNSYYKLQILESDNKNKYWLFRSWGRIGTTCGGNKTEDCKSLYDAKGKFEDLYFDKTDNMWMDRHEFMKMPGKMYPVDIDYGDDEPVKKLCKVNDKSSSLPEPVQNLVQMIFDVDVMKKVMLEFELDTEKMPLGKLSRKQLTAGYKVLTELQKILSNQKNKSSASNQGKIIDATNRFYTLIPHDFGVDNPPLLDDEELIKTKTSMLDNLLEIEIAYSMLKEGSDSTASPLDTHYIQLKSEIAPVHKDSPEFEMALKYVKNTHAATHRQYELEIVNLFKVNREGEDKRFKPFKKIPHRRLLWHGSRVTNFAGILSQGLRIAPPEAPVTGYMFGKGIYFADMVSKSANYCCTSSSSNIGVLLLCEVALGEMHELTQATYITKLPPGKNSVKGIGRTEPDPSEDFKLDCGTIVPLGKPVTQSIKSSLLYNEYIVYDVAQVNVKYLFQMKFNYKF